MLARVNLRWLLAVLIVLGLAAVAMPFLNPPPADVPPTLVGIESPPADPVLIPRPAPGNPVVVQEPRPIGVTAFRPAPGVPLADARDLEAAASLLARAAHPRIGPFVHRVIDGMPAVELAGSALADDWTAVETYIFGGDVIIAVTCMLARNDPDARLADCSSVVDSLVLA